jgi:hypothetical protein
MKRNLVKKAEQNMVDVAREYQLMFDVLDALAVFGNNFTHEWVGGKKFFEGLSLMRDGVFAEYTQASMNAMMFAGLSSGDEARKFAKERLDVLFSGKDGTKYAIMNFLEKNGRYPGSYMTKDEEDFRNEMKEELSKGEQNE